MDLDSVAEINDLISGFTTKNISELIKYRNQLTEAFNEKINHLRTIKKAQRERKKKVVRPRLYISDSSSDEFNE
jgi:hypothetical protein